MPDTVRLDQSTSWRASFTEKYVFITVSCGGREGPENCDDDFVEIALDPKRMWPFPPFRVHRDGRAYFDVMERHNKHNGISGFSKAEWDSHLQSGNTGWQITVKVPLDDILRREVRKYKPLRINVGRYRDGSWVKWVDKPPVTRRLGLGSRDPEEYGWIIFNGHS